MQRTRTSACDELIDEAYRGIRPAPGYPACPDHTEKGVAVRPPGGTAAHRHHDHRELRDASDRGSERLLLLAPPIRSTSPSAAWTATRSRTMRADAAGIYAPPNAGLRRSWPMSRRPGRQHDPRYLPLMADAAVATSVQGFSPDEVRRFRAEGFVVARGLADAATCARILAVMRDHLAREVAPAEYEAQLHYPGAPESMDAPGGHTVRRLLQACSRDPVFLEWATSPLVATRLHQLMGPDVQLAQAHHNCVMTKQPRYSSVTGWHQDVRYWSFERPELVSVWLALGHEHPDNGCLSLIPGTHLLEVSRGATGCLALPARGSGAEPLLDRYARYASARAGRHVVLSLPHVPRGGRRTGRRRPSSRW